MVQRSSLAVSSPEVTLSPVATAIVSNDQQTARVLLDRLRAHPGLNVGSLVVHQCPAAGLCIEGHVELVDPNVNLAALFAEIESTTPILNRVMVTMPATVATPVDV